MKSSSPLTQAPRDPLFSPTPLPNCRKLDSSTMSIQKANSPLQQTECILKCVFLPIQQTKILTFDTSRTLSELEDDLKFKFFPRTQVTLHFWASEYGATKIDISKLLDNEMCISNLSQKLINSNHTDSITLYVSVNVTIRVDIPDDNCTCQVVWPCHSSIERFKRALRRHTGTEESYIHLFPAVQTWKKHYVFSHELKDDSLLIDALDRLTLGSDGVYFNLCCLGIVPVCVPMETRSVHILNLTEDLVRTDAQIRASAGLRYLTQLEASSTIQTMYPLFKEPMIFRPKSRLHTHVQEMIP